MKRLIFLIFFIFIIIANISFALPNPAAVYCKQMNYNYNIIKTPQGESGECIFPDKTKCDEWEFFKGKCGQKYSYCEKNGYGIKTVSDKKNYISEYSVCIPKKSDKGEIKIDDVVKLNQDLILSEVTTTINTENVGTELTSSSLPEEFDWRNKHGKNYVTDIRNQGSCGSCWAFATASTLEGEVNAYYNNPDLDINLSEQDLVSCFAVSGCSGIYTSQFSSLFSYIKNTGIANESCFPYTATNNNCNNKCSYWISGVWKISSFYEDIYPTISSMKNAVITKGSVTVGMTVYSDFFSYTGGIYHHTSSSIAGYHAVAIVGFGSYNGEDYWIVKNSWGKNWGENGYFRIRMGDSGIDSTFTYAVNQPIPPTPQTVICTDEDSDGYCNWGLGSKPTNCPLCSDTIEDCDDSNGSIYTDCNVDIIPPSSVTDLSVVKTKATSIVLSWSASGDDGLEGKTYYYKMAYSNETITETNFDSNNNFYYYGSESSGTKINYTLHDLKPNTFYYLAIKAYDNSDNPSGISNIVSSTTTSGYLLFSDNVENGNNGWTTSFIFYDNRTPTGNPLWHITEHKSKSSTHSWYYGIENQWNYNNGVKNNGSLISPVINTSKYSDLYLLLDYSADLEPENKRYADSFYSEIRGDGMGGNIMFFNKTTNGEFVNQISRIWTEGDFQVAFNFDTIDELYNDYEGIFIDDIRIIATDIKPVANGGGPYSGDTVNPIKFDASYSYDEENEPLTYFWFFGDGSSEQGKIVNHLYIRPGIYDVYLYVSDGYATSYYETKAYVCSPSINLSLSPTLINAPKIVTAQISVSIGCYNKNVYVKKDSCYGAYACNCVPSVNDGKCSCNFQSPTTSNIYKYYACLEVGINDQEYLQGSSYYFSPSFGQSFTTSAINITKARIQILSGSSKGYVNVSLRNNSINGDILASDKAYVDALSWYTFNFPSISVKNGKKYYLSIKGDYPINVRAGYSNPYSNGEMYIYENVNSNLDLNFQTFGIGYAYDMKTLNVSISSGGGGGSGCGFRSCLMVAVGPYLLQIDPTPIVLVVSVILTLTEIVVLALIIKKLEKSNRRR